MNDRTDSVCCTLDVPLREISTVDELLRFEEPGLLRRSRKLQNCDCVNVRVLTLLLGRSDGNENGHTHHCRLGTGVPKLPHILPG